MDIKIPAQELAKKLTIAGLEVTSLEKKNGDFVFEFEITSNRPDCLSVIGIAREAAAITGKKLKLDTGYSMLDTGKGKRASSIQHPASKLEIKVESKKDCPLYTARIIKGIRVKPSPDWLKRRLELVGVRSVNNIVDITNYVLMETGQPLHAFDLNQLVSQSASQPVSQSASQPVSQSVNIIVRRAREKEDIVTIDGVKRTLDKDVLIIAADRQTGRQADRKTGRPVAIAGIMGGLDSEVKENTSAVLLEAAVFSPIITRRASRSLGLSSESSYRFERGIDSQGVDFASLRAANLILKLAGGGLVLSKSTIKPKVKKRAIILNTEEVNRVLGRNFPVSQIRKILTSLCFIVKKQKVKELKIDAPSFRIDISQPVDLIEEVARISGYENIPTRLPRITPQMETSSNWQGRRIIKDILISQGISEVVTYSLISKIRANEFGYSDAQLITVANPLTSEQGVLRPSMIPGLVSCIGYNLNQKQKDIRIFEIGNIFRDKQELPYLGLACSGGGFNLLHIKGMLTLLLERRGITDFGFVKLDGKHPSFEEEASLSLMTGGDLCANLGMIKPDILERLDIGNLVFAAELDLAILFAKIGKIQKRYIPLPSYPEVLRDISIMIKQDIPIGDVIKKIKISTIPYLIEVNVKDCYSGKQIPSGFKGVTLSCIYQAKDHTLITQEIDNSHQEVLNILKFEFSAQQR